MKWLITVVFLVALLAGSFGSFGTSSVHADEKSKARAAQTTEKVVRDYMEKVLKDEGLSVSGNGGRPWNYHPRLGWLQFLVELHWGEATDSSGIRWTAWFAWSAKPQKVFVREKFASGWKYELPIVVDNSWNNQGWYNTDSDALTSLAFVRPGQQPFSEANWTPECFDTPDGAPWMATLYFQRGNRTVLLNKADKPLYITTDGGKRWLPLVRERYIAQNSGSVGVYKQRSVKAQKCATYTWR